MAFFCADEPSAFNVPEKQSPAEVDPDEDAEEVPDAVVVVVLLSEPHAASESEPSRASIATWEVRVIFTVLPSKGCKSISAGCN